MERGRLCNGYIAEALNGLKGLNKLKEGKVCAIRGESVVDIFICVTGEIRWLYFFALERPYRLAVRTPPFHGGSRGSIPLRVAIFVVSVCVCDARRRLRGR